MAKKVRKLLKVNLKFRKFSLCKNILKRVLSKLEKIQFFYFGKITSSLQYASMLNGNWREYHLRNIHGFRISGLSIQENEILIITNLTMSSVYINAILRMCKYLCHRNHRYLSSSVEFF